MTGPIVAIVGRPNVGKSSLFNWLVGRRVSIVDPTAGVTRDRLSAPIQVGDRHIELVDTGGMGIEDADDLTAEVERQIAIAIEQADIILFLLDARTGVVPLDEEVARRLRAVKKPVLCVANKCDYNDLDAHASDFYRLGYGDVTRVSAEQRKGKRELFDAILQRLPEHPGERPPERVALNIAIVGRRNVGKSTFINALAEADRVIVSEVPGTTRDSVDVRFVRDGKTFVAIDTAGVRRKKSLANDIEFYSMTRAEASIRRADVVLHFFDPRLRISKVDKQLTDYVLQYHKPTVFVINKWDLAKERTTTEAFGTYVRQLFPMLDFVPVAFVTAKDGRNVYKLLNLAQQLAKQAAKRLTTGELNRTLRAAMEANPPPMRQNRTPKLYFVTQTSASPPTVILFVNNPELFDQTYVRYLEKTLRDQTHLREVPVKLELRSKKDAMLAGGKPAFDADAGMDDLPSDDDTVVDTVAVEKAKSVVAPAPPPEPVSVPPVPTPERPRSRKRGDRPGGLWTDL